MPYPQPPASLMSFFRRADSSLPFSPAPSWCEHKFQALRISQNIPIYLTLAVLPRFAPCFTLKIAFRDLPVLSPTSGLFLFYIFYSFCSLSTCTFPVTAVLAAGHRAGHVPGEQRRAPRCVSHSSPAAMRPAMAALHPAAFACTGSPRALRAVQCKGSVPDPVPGSAPLSPREDSQPSQLPPQHPRLALRSPLPSPRFPNAQLLCCKHCCSSTRVKLSKQRLLEFSTGFSDIYPTYLIYLSGIIKRFQIPFYLFRLDFQFQTRYLSCASWLLF